MSCSVAVCNSPVFSPPSSLFCCKTSIFSAPQETQTLTLTHLKSSASPSSPPAATPASLFRLRLQKPPTGLRSPPCFALESVSGASTSQSPSGAVLKRKRPTRLDIPVAPAGFGAPTLATPREERREIERDGDGYSVYCKRGRREALEDRFSAVTYLRGDPRKAIFGVFDGHGGAKAAEFAAKNLDRNILEEVDRKDECEIEVAVKQGYKTTDAKFLEGKDVRGGSCCVTALVSNGNLVVSNAGDCRAVLCRGGAAEALTSDHRSSREDERHRMESSGGYVDEFRGVWRIQGSLAVSRGIGDRHLKQWVIAEPETRILRIEPEHEFLILASDGLWDKVNNQEAVDMARSLCMGTEKPTPLLACKMLADLSASRGSLDDISVMLIALQRFVSI